MKTKHHLAITILMFLGLTIMVNQVSQPVTIVRSAIEAQNDDSDANPTTDDDSFVLQANLVVNSISQVTPHHELYQIREILLDEVADPLPVHDTNLISETNHFRTLFRKVISANAP